MNMKKKLKLMAGWSALALLMLPCVLVLNENMECWPINLLGLLYAWWFCKNVKGLFELPQRRERRTD